MAAHKSDRETAPQHYFSKHGGLSTCTPYQKSMDYVVLSFPNPIPCQLTIMLDAKLGPAYARLTLGRLTAQYSFNCTLKIVGQRSLLQGHRIFPTKLTAKIYTEMAITYLWAIVMWCIEHILMG